MEEEFKTGGLFILKGDQGFVIGYKPVYFHDAPFAPMLNVCNDEIIDDMEDLFPAIRFSQIFDCDGNSFITRDQLKEIEKKLNTEEFVEIFKNKIDKTKIKPDDNLLSM